MSNFWGAASRWSRNNWYVTWWQIMWRHHSHLYLTVRNDYVFRLCLWAIGRSLKNRSFTLFWKFWSVRSWRNCVCVAGEVLYVLKPSKSIAQGTMQDVNVAKLLSLWSVVRVFEQCGDSCIVACRHRQRRTWRPVHGTETLRTFETQVYFHFCW